MYLLWLLGMKMFPLRQILKKWKWSLQKKTYIANVGYVFSAMLATFIPTNKYLKKAFYCWSLDWQSVSLSLYYDHDLSYDFASLLFCLLVNNVQDQIF